MRAGGFFAQPPRVVRSLKTQQRVNVETSRARVSFCASTKLRGQIPSRPLGDVTFELRLEVEDKLAPRGKPLFTESLILAQDERWRRA